MKRYFSKRQKTALYIASLGRCALCGNKLKSGWHADHNHPWVKGGTTNIINGLALCPACNLKKGKKDLIMTPDERRFIQEWGLPIKPRLWQPKSIRELRDNLRKGVQNLFAVITTGGGKTLLTLAFYLRLRNDGVVRRLVIVCHSDAIKKGWTENKILPRLKELGLLSGIKDIGNASGGREPADFEVCVITYQAVANNPIKQQEICKEIPTAVAFDEVHHLGENQDWGLKMQEAFKDAKVRLGLTATPWRRPKKGLIPGADYDADGFIISHTRFTYPKSILEGCCRPVRLYAFDGEVRYVSLDKYVADPEVRTLSDDEDEDNSNVLAELIHPDSRWFADIVRRAWRHLEVYMTGEDGLPPAPNAKLLINVDNQKYADKAAKKVKKITGQEPIVIKSEDGPEAIQRLEEFRNNPNKHIAIAINMVNEGVDAPDIYGIVYATRQRSPLRVIQIIGRALRRQGEEDIREAFVYGPAVPSLLKHFKALSDESILATTMAEALKQKDIRCFTRFNKETQQEEQLLQERLKQWSLSWDEGGRELWEEAMQEANIQAWAEEMLREHEEKQEKIHQLGYGVAGISEGILDRIATQSDTYQEYDAKSPEYLYAEQQCIKRGWPTTMAVFALELLHDHGSLPQTFPKEEISSQYNSPKVGPDAYWDIMRDSLASEIATRVNEINIDKEHNSEVYMLVNGHVNRKFKCERRHQMTTEQFREAIRFVRETSFEELTDGRYGNNGTRAS